MENFKVMSGKPLDRRHCAVLVSLTQARSQDGELAAVGEPRRQNCVTAPELPHTQKYSSLLQQ